MPYRRDPCDPSNVHHYNSLLVVAVAPLISPIATLPGSRLLHPTTKQLKMGKEQDLLDASRSGHFTIVEKVLSARIKKSGPLTLTRYVLSIECVSGQHCAPNGVVIKLDWPHRTGHTRGPA